MLSCPSGFIHSSGSRCVRCVSSPENGYCGGACREKHIRSIGDFQSLKYCSRVHTLNIYNIATVDSRGDHFNDAFVAFDSLEQIDHEFTIHNVKIFSTLSIFTRLRNIGITANATITIEENEFLTELWPLSQPPPIIQGSLNIVRNARLCLKHISDFINYTTTHEKGSSFVLRYRSCQVTFEIFQNYKSLRTRTTSTPTGTWLRASRTICG